MRTAAQSVEAARRAEVSRRWLLSAPALAVLVVASVGPLFIVLLFFAWLWGLAGLLLGAPLLAIAKVVCDRVESLKPVGELLGR